MRILRRERLAEKRRWSVVATQVLDAKPEIIRVTDGSQLAAEVPLLTKRGDEWRSGCTGLII